MLSCVSSMSSSTALPWTPRSGLSAGCCSVHDSGELSKSTIYCILLGYIIVDSVILDHVMRYFIISYYSKLYYAILYSLGTPCGGEVLHVCFKMSRAKHPMQHHVSPHRRCRCFVHVSREAPDVRPCHTSPPQGVRGPSSACVATCCYMFLHLVICCHMLPTCSHERAFGHSAAILRRHRLS